MGYISNSSCIPDLGEGQIDFRTQMVCRKLSPAKKKIQWNQQNRCGSTADQWSFPSFTIYLALLRRGDSAEVDILRGSLESANARCLSEKDLAEHRFVGSFLTWTISFGHQMLSIYTQLYTYTHNLHIHICVYIYIYIHIHTIYIYRLILCIQILRVYRFSS